ncbi:MAG TPA: type IV toxin-antitoxin system AbiEi family antitoxin [Candidatus Acidoferrales bacterium]|nr:type IV toxin-antitoxin system AbiEi family antitoxin [Candidatus Acidoferrales bacterium]
MSTGGAPKVIASDGTRDLVGYAGHAGGLNQVATVLSELAERLDPERLALAARTAPIPWAQRLGFLLEHLGFEAKVPALKEYVRQHAMQSTVLLPQAQHKRATYSTWRQP